MNPRPERSTPAKYPPAIPNSERHLPEINLPVVPKRRLGMRLEKRRFAPIGKFARFRLHRPTSVNRHHSIPPDSGHTPPNEIRQAALGGTHSQAAFGNDRVPPRHSGIFIPRGRDVKYPPRTQPRGMKISGMTTGGRGWIVPVGGATPDRLKVQGRRKVQPRKQGNRNQRAELTRSCWCRSGVEPPTGKLHPRQISSRNSKSGKTSPEMNLLFDSCFSSVVPLLSRGWIVPVGGATPDRLKAQGRRKVRPRKQGNRNRRAEIVLLMRSCLCRLGNAGRPCAGRGLNPRPE